jgi:hypothetical protein
MFALMNPEPKRPRIRTEREYREWQRSLRGYRTVRQHKSEPGLVTRLTSTIRRMAAQRSDRTTDPRPIEQETSRLHG